MLVLLDDKCDKTNTEVKIRPEKNCDVKKVMNR